MLNASADTISLKSNRFTLDSTYTKIAADGTITCSNLNCTNAKITGGSINITTSSKEETKLYYHIRIHPLNLLRMELI